ncbi:MAG: aromatic-ring-hydroxylating dioxygenase beta subunit [Pseudarthrobacter sp.]|nr:aromatic-ring-hydroxylating dioxygenase beta subunit [Pseudarthrobacter sp.]
MTGRNMAEMEVRSTAMAALEDQVRQLMDREEIRGVMMDYCRGVDRRDYGLIRAAYHHDAFDDHGNFEGGPEAVVSKVSKDPEGTVVTSSMHHVGNIRIELNGDTADVESYFVAYATLLSEGRNRLTSRAGRYLDRFERREGKWRIAHRKVADDWSCASEVIDTPEIGRHTGTRDGSDPSHSFFSS